MNHNHQIDSEHSDSINESRVYKISHTRRWIEFSIVIIVVAVLAIIVTNISNHGCVHRIQVKKRTASSPTRTYCFKCPLPPQTPPSHVAHQ